MTEQWQQENARVLALMEKGQLPQAIDLATKLVARMVAEPGEHRPQLALSLHNLGELYLMAGRVEEAGQPLQQALALYQEYYGPEAVEAVETLGNLAEIDISHGSLLEAGDKMAKIAAILEDQPNETERWMQVLHNLAMIRRGQGEWGQCRQTLEKGLSEGERRLGAHHPHLAHFCKALGGLDLQAGQLDGAEERLRRAISILEKSGNVETPEFAACLGHLAEVYLMRGHVAAADPFFGQALQILKATLGEKHPEYGALLEKMAGMYLATGKKEQAEKALRQVVDCYLGCLGQENETTAQAQNALAEMYLDTSRHELAYPLLQASLAARQKLFGKNHPAVAQSHNNLGVVHALRGEKTLALKSMARPWRFAKRCLARIIPPSPSRSTILPPYIRSEANFPRPNSCCSAP